MPRLLLIDRRRRQCRFSAAPSHKPCSLTAGFLVLEGFATAEEVQQLKQRGEELVSGGEAAGERLRVGSTGASAA